jgi:hypothetical protein
VVTEGECGKMTLTNDNITKYITDRFSKLSSEEISSISPFHGRRYSRFQIELMKKFDEDILNKITKEV